MKLRIVKMGLIDYEEALEIQYELQQQRIEGKCEDTLLLLEHKPVITLGTRGDVSNILLDQQLLMEQGVKIVECNRGGDVTYHGPGQIVGYLIMNLKNYDKDIRSFIQKIQSIFLHIIDLNFNMIAHTEDGKYTGVFVEQDKITAIGIAVNKWVTMHGFAFNVNTCLDHFKWIVPCGLQDKGVTSIEKLTGKPNDIEYLMNLIVQQFETVFHVTSYEEDLKTLLISLGKESV
ncbi:MAG: octanoyltransferase [Firmicutes bacterium HGW-Firmicutes-1]|jgi:lipoyl(octanoyl) transferase|nr:MAG: octanoyltransferase [Firmicutes bacterium HGW-Firmicutes-1]